MQINKLLIRGFISLTLLLLSCTSKKVKNDILPPLSISTAIGSWKSVPPYNFLSVITTLTNNTSDTLRYVSMSCSWQDVYTLDTNVLTVHPEICDFNIPILVAIPPHGQEQKALALVTENNKEYLKSLNFRVGFNWLSAKDYTEAFEKSHERSAMKNVIWSEPLQIPWDYVVK